MEFKDAKRLSPLEPHKYVQVVALRDMKSGETLFADYNPRTHVKTKSKSKKKKRKKQKERSQSPKDSLTASSSSSLSNQQQESSSSSAIQRGKCVVCGSDCPMDIKWCQACAKDFEEDPDYDPVN